MLRFSTLLKKLQDGKVNQTELARWAKMPQSTINMIARGKVDQPRRATQNKMLRAFDMMDAKRKSLGRKEIYCNYTDAFSRVERREGRGWKPYTKASLAKIPRKARK